MTLPCASSRVIAASKILALLIRLAMRATFFVSSRYTTVCTVVYAGRGSGNASWISRTELGPRLHSVSMICNSSLVSLVDAIGAYVVRLAYYDHRRIARLI